MLPMSLPPSLEAPELEVMVADAVDVEAGLLVAIKVRKAPPSNGSGFDNRLPHERNGLLTMYKSFP